MLVSIAMFELGGALGLEEEELLGGAIVVIEGMAPAAAFIIIESSISIMFIESMDMRAESMAIAAGLMT